MIKVVYSGDAAGSAGRSPSTCAATSQNKVIKQRLKDADDELELVIVKDMMLTGFDSPPLHTLYLDRPLKGALLMQTLARVNRTFRGKDDGLLVGYAPLAENLQQGAGRVHRDRPGEQAGGQGRRRGRRRCVAELLERSDELLRRLRLASADRAAADRKSWFERGRSARPTTCASRPRRATRSPRARRRLADRFRRLAGQLARAWALRRRQPRRWPTLRPEVQFYEEVRVWMAKFDAEERQAERRAGAGGDPAAAGRADRRQSTATGEVVDIYEAAGMPEAVAVRPEPEFAAKAQQATQPAAGHRGAAQADRRGVGRGDPQQPRPPAGVLRADHRADEPLHQPAAHLRRGHRRAGRAGQGGRRRGQPRARSSPRRWIDDELAFYDAVARNESAVEVQGEDVLAQIARELVAVMRRDVTHRLDRPRRRPGQAAVVDQAAAGEVQVPAGQAARGDQARHGADGAMAPRYADSRY